MGAGSSGAGSPPMLPPVSVGAGVVNGAIGAVGPAGKLSLHPSSIIPRPGLLNVHHPPFSGIGGPGSGGPGSGSALHPPFTSNAGGNGGAGGGPGGAAASLFGPGPPGHPAFYSPHHSPATAAGLMAADLAARGGGGHPHPALQAAAAAAAAAGLTSGAAGYNSAPHFPSPAEHALKAAQTQGLSYAEWLARTSMYMPRIPLDYPGSFPGKLRKKKTTISDLISYQ